MADVKAEVKRLTDFLPDSHNANRGTQRGARMLETSVREDGAGRSLLATADGTLMAGNKTQQALIDAGLEEVIVVHTDGRKAVIVQRDDVQSGTAEAQRMALRDNRTSEVGLDWDPEVLADLEADGVDMSAAFYPEELEEIMVQLERYDFSKPTAVQRRQKDEPVFLKLVISIQHHSFIERIIRQLMDKYDITRGEAFVKVCELAETQGG